MLVTEGGVPVTGLKPADFEVRDNGVVQHVDRVSLEQIPLNVVEVLDMSDSVAGARLQNLRRAAGALLDGLQKGDQAGLVTFGETVAQRSALTEDWQRLRDELASMEAGGLTSLVDGTYTGMILAQSDPDRALTVVFSDGVDTASWLTPNSVLDIAKRSDTVVYAVSAAYGRAPKFLRDLTQFTGGQVFDNTAIDALPATFTRILAEFRQRYVVTYSPSGVAAGGWHEVRVTIPRDKRATVRVRPGYVRGPGS